MQTVTNPVIKWCSPKRVLGKTLFDMLPTTGEMMDAFVKHRLVENLTGNYHIDVHNMCRNGATYLGTGVVEDANKIGDNKRTYIMADFKDRLLEEKSQLDEKIGKLKTFIGGEGFPNIDPKQQELLNEQLPVMEKYSSILDSRIGLL